MGRRHQNRADLVQGNCQVPVFIMTLEQQHHPVALADAGFQQEAAGLRGQTADVTEGKHFFLSVLVAPLDGTLVRLGIGNGIHNVIAEIEIVRIVQCKACKLAFLVIGCLAELFAKRDHNCMPPQIRVSPKLCFYILIWINVIEPAQRVCTGS